MQINLYECDWFFYLERKVKDLSNRYNSIRLVIFCDSNEDEDYFLRELEGLLLYFFYLQLLVVGWDGILLRGFFVSFELQILLLRFVSNWREKVKSYLKSGFYFEEVKGCYILCEFLVQFFLKRIFKRKESFEWFGEKYDN